MQPWLHLPWARATQYCTFRILRQRARAASLQHSQCIVGDQIALHPPPPALDEEEPSESDDDEDSLAPATEEDGDDNIRWPLLRLLVIEGGELQDWCLSYPTM
eukprot:jgi/Psemu1/48531/gm1.48531_g